MDIAAKAGWSLQPVAPSFPAFFSVEDREERAVVLQFKASPTFTSKRKGTHAWLFIHIGHHCAPCQCGPPKVKAVALSLSLALYAMCTVWEQPL